MKTFLAASAALVTLASAGSAFAVTQESSSVSTGPIAVTGNVPALCAFGQVNTDVGAFALGTLIDTTTGLLRTDLTPTPKTITGSWCNAQSTLNVSAVLLTAQNFTAAPPAGFSTGVHFTATATGWTPSAATYDTSIPGAQASATQVQTQPNAGTITLNIGSFATRGGSNLRPVADTSYSGTVTLTLTPTA